MIWTPEQEKAIYFDLAGSGSAIVSAAAGSGKTAVLVHRIIHLLKNEKNKIPADRIAAITFTVKAADELRMRLEKALAEEFALNSSDWLEEQRIRLEDAKICTIDAFCIDIVRKHADDIGYQNDFRILDASEATELSEKAMNDALSDFYGDSFSEAERTALFKLHGKTGDGIIVKTILALDDFLMKSPDPVNNLTRKTEYYNNPEILRTMLAAPKIKDIGAWVKRGIALAEENAEICASVTNAYNRAAADLNLFKKWEEADFAVPSSVEPLLSQKVKSGTFTANALIDVKDILKENHAEYRLLLSAICENAAMIISFDKVVSCHAAAIGTLSKLYTLYSGYYSGEKLRAGGMTFSDAEQFCLDLLRKDDGRIARSLLFEQIIVDEFQDCNRLQCEIFNSLNTGGNRLFYVGDVKQLIYRFRSSDPKIFTETLNNPCFTPLLLNKNFRSSHEVIDSVNNIFTGLMTIECGGVEYDRNTRLEYGLDVVGGADYETELVIITGVDDTENGAEPEYVASKIREMIDSGFTVAVKENTKVRRPVRYDDFAIITNALSPVENRYINAFKKYGIPYIRGGKGDFVSQGEVDVVIDLLLVIDNPYRDIRLINVLMSPLYSFTPDDVASVRLFARDVRNKKGDSAGAVSLYDDLCMFAENDNLELKRKIDRFLSELAYRRALCKRNSVSKLVRLVLRQGVFEPLAAASENPGKVFANLRLMEYYADSHAEKKSTLSEFAGFLSEIRERKQKMGDADVTASINTGAVNLLTIHGSKGLEFPVCFVTETCRKFDKREVSRNLILDEEIGFASRYIDDDSLIRYKTLTFERAADNIKKALISEEVRKLYVAATRARDKLIFTSYTETDEAEKTESFYKWVSGKVKNIRLSVSDIKPPPENSLSTEENADSDELPDILPYEREILTQIPIKLTATQIGVVRKSFLDDDDEPSLFPRNPSFLQSGGLTGKKRGDAYHKVMESIDFRNPDYRQQLEDMREFFTEEEFAAVNAADIIEFFNSPLGQRAVKSDRVVKEFGLFTELCDFTELGLPSVLNEKFAERPFIQGKADMFFYEDGKIILVDYKTNRGMTAERFIAEYSRQLTVYKQAISEMTGTEVSECYIYSFEIGAIPVTIF